MTSLCVSHVWSLLVKTVAIAGNFRAVQNFAFFVDRYIIVYNYFVSLSLDCFVCSFCMFLVLFTLKQNG